MPFGKYKGQPVEAMMADRDYCGWALAQPGVSAMKRLSTTLAAVALSAIASATGANAAEFSSRRRARSPLEDIRASPSTNARSTPTWLKGLPCSS